MICSIILDHEEAMDVVFFFSTYLQFPTFLDLAGVPAEDDLDGRSLKNIFLGREDESDVRV